MKAYQSLSLQCQWKKETKKSYVEKEFDVNLLRGRLKIALIRLLIRVDKLINCVSIGISNLVSAFAVRR